MIKTLKQLQKEKKGLALVDGVFDPLHDGHIEYFRIAKKKSKNLKLVCSCSSDKITITKHPVFLKQNKRIKILESIKYIDYVILNTNTTADLLNKLKPKYYLKGIDWKNKLPLKEVQICKLNDIKIRYIKAKKNSSSKILREYVKKNRNTKRI